VFVARVEALARYKLEEQAKHGELVGLAEGRRSPLEAAASLLIARLHRRSDDFAATGALCSVSGALNRIGWAMRPAPVRRRWTGSRPPVAGTTQ